MIRGRAIVRMRMVLGPGLLIMLAACGGIFGYFRVWYPGEITIASLQFLIVPEKIRSLTKIEGLGFVSGRRFPPDLDAMYEVKFSAPGKMSYWELKSHLMRHQGWKFKDADFLKNESIILFEAGDVDVMVIHKDDDEEVRFVYTYDKLYQP